MPTAHGWVNMRVEPGCLIPSLLYIMFCLTWDQLEKASYSNRNFTLRCLLSSWVLCLMLDPSTSRAPSQTGLPFILGTLLYTRLPINRWYPSHFFLCKTMLLSCIIFRTPSLALYLKLFDPICLVKSDSSWNWVYIGSHLIFYCSSCTYKLTILMPLIT